ncbi:hypothetical protein Hdeb2414_s0867g00955791 [Helianthus debilis subsp. tardiflorus]
MCKTVTYWKNIQRLKAIQEHELHSNDSEYDGWCGSTWYGWIWNRNSGWNWGWKWDRDHDADTWHVSTILGMQTLGVNNNTAAHVGLPQQTAGGGARKSAQSKYVKVWEGNLSGQRQGQPVFITRLEGYQSATASESLAANWPPTMQIIRLISQDHMNNKITQNIQQPHTVVFSYSSKYSAAAYSGFLSRIQLYCGP